MTSVLFYDGVCGLCNRLVRFLLRRDRHARLLFAPLQGALARTALGPHGYDPSDLDTVYVIADRHTPSERVLAKSPAILHVLDALGGGWRVLARAGSLVPVALADGVYDAVATRRYRTFGKLESCPIPPPEWRARFIEDDKEETFSQQSKRIAADNTSNFMHGFDYGILRVTDHRPWPMPASPWMMTQTWHDLLFAHWPIDRALLDARIPAGLELDLFEGQAWVGVVPFHMTNVAPRGVPALPWISAFPELNVRTYVRAGGRAGVYFFSLDAANSLAVGVARTLLHLPYYSASMRVETRDGWIHYRSRRTSAAAGGAELVGRYRPAGDVREPAGGTLEHFLTERYCLFTVDHASHPHRLDIHHPPWQLQPAEATLTVNTMADAAGVRLPDVAPLLHFARRQDAVAWLPSSVGT